MTPLRLIFSDHALQRMFERQISPETVREVLENGEWIEEYPDDSPFPSRLVVGGHGSRFIHVVAADNPELEATVVITAYEPDPDQWQQPDFRQRKGSL